jgi:hypothetical protein
MGKSPPKERVAATMQPSFPLTFGTTLDWETVMRRWRLVEEPSLEELLDDEIMAPVMRSAGLDEATLRRELTALARRLGKGGQETRDRRSCSCCWSSL